MSCPGPEAVKDAGGGDDDEADLEDLDASDFYADALKDA